MPWEVFATPVYVPTLRDFGARYPLQVNALEVGGDLRWVWDLVVTSEHVALAIYWADLNRGLPKYRRGLRPGVQAVCGRLSTEALARGVDTKSSKEGEWRKIKRVVGMIVATMLLKNGFRLERSEDLDERAKDPKRLLQQNVNHPDWNKAALYVRDAPSPPPAQVQEIMKDLAQMASGLE